MPIKLLTSGTKSDIFVYIDYRQACPTTDFIDELTKSEQVKIIALINRFAQHGEIRNEQKFRIEESPIFTFKSFQVRVPCFFLPGAEKRAIVLTHAFKKKSDKIPKQELERARRIYNEVNEEKRKVK